MLHQTRWSPDTCKCEIVYEWDDSTSEDKRVHKIHHISNKCGDHLNIRSDEDHYNLVLEENQRKNKVHSHIIENHPELTILDSNSNPVLKKGVFEWEFDEKRNLNIKVNGISSTEKQKMQIKLDTIHGINKVNVK